MAVYACIAAAFLIYYLWQYFSILRRRETCEVHETVLSHPNLSVLYRRAVYYTVSFQDNSGRCRNMDTKPIWSDQMFPFCQMSDYNSQKVKILFDPDRERITVLDRVRE